MRQRYFRASPEVYATALKAINSALGLPANGQENAFAPLDEAPRDGEGRCYLAVWDFFCEYESVAPSLSALLANGSVEEIDEEAYRAGLYAQPGV